MKGTPIKYSKKIVRAIIKKTKPILLKAEWSPKNI
jgi:hypothetical protein